MKGVPLKQLKMDSLMFAMSLPALRMIFNPHLQNLKLISVLIKYGYNPLSDYGSWRVNVGMRGHVIPQGRYSPAFAILNEGG